jgi:hypothetical protein
VFLVAAVPPVLVVPAPLAVADAEPPIPVELPADKLCVCAVDPLTLVDDEAPGSRLRVASAESEDPIFVDWAARLAIAAQFASINTPRKLCAPAIVEPDAFPPTALDRVAEESAGAVDVGLAVELGLGLAVELAGFDIAPPVLEPVGAELVGGEFSVLSCDEFVCVLD